MRVEEDVVDIRRPRRVDIVVDWRNVGLLQQTETTGSETRLVLDVEAGARDQHQDGQYQAAYEPDEDGTRRTDRTRSLVVDIALPTFQ